MTAPRHPMIRDYVAADLCAVLALNQGALPHVSHLSTASLARLAAQAATFRLIGPAAATARGFLIALRPGADYASENYRWFCDRYADFFYIDRIVIHPEAMRRGHGRALYADTIAAADALMLPLACEVNTEPPNPVSDAFHDGFGFETVGEQETEGGTKRVGMLLRRAS